MPEWIVALLLGLIEGLTEFIPVSSTGHLLIFEALTQEHRPDYFNIFIQCGAALALVPVFWRRITEMVRSLGGSREAAGEPGAQAPRDYALKLGLAFGITVVGGLLLDHFDVQLPDEATPVAWATLLGAFVIFAVEAAVRRRPGSAEITWLLAVVFALGQLVAAFFPGASRSGSTIMLAMLFGLARPAATEFSFLLGMPTLLAAGGYKLLKAVKSGELAGAAWLELWIAFFAAAISAFLVVKWLLRFVQSHTFNGFAVYRLVLGVALLSWLALSPEAPPAGDRPENVIEVGD